VIRPNFLSDPYDREISIAMFRYIRRWIEQPALAPLIARELSPGSEIETDEQILDALLRRGATGMHACGTCAMGEGPDAVVDEKLRVRGVSRLRVVDGSIMPTMPSANTNGPIIAVGWRASELILADRND
jgi:choline dehydrogenase